MAGDEGHIEGARAPPLPPYAPAARLQLMCAMQPTVAVERGVLGDEHRIEERALLDAAPRLRLVHRRHRAHRAVEPVDHRLQACQPITEIRSDGQHDAAHASTPARSGPRSFLAAILTRGRLR